jgi:hypothetical protein
MTTATIFGRASRTVDQIDAEARQLDPRKVALTLVALPFFVLGVVLAGMARGSWLVVAWVWVAVVAGWRVSWPPTSRDDNA